MASKYNSNIIVERPPFPQEKKCMLEFSSGFIMTKMKFWSPSITEHFAKYLPKMGLPDLQFTSPLCALPLPDLVKFV